MSTLLFVDAMEEIIGIPPMEKIEVHGKKLNKRLIELQDNSSIRCWWIYYIDSDFLSRDKILIV